MMSKITAKYVGFSVVLMILSFFVWGVDPVSSEKKESEESLKFRILIKHNDVFGKLTRPPVEFKHDFHANILKKEGCGTCHHLLDKVKQKPVYKEGFEQSCGSCHKKEAVDSTQSLMDAFHNKCVACHKENVKKDKKSGPMTCGDCHVKRTAYAEFQNPLEFDHAGHLSIMANEKMCGNCHHEEVDGKLVYVKGNEVYCSKCHLDADEKNRRSLRNVYHADCYGCHRKNLEEGAEKNGPATCFGCHGKMQQFPSKEALPQYMRKFEADPEKLMLWHPGAKLPAVSYDHKVHNEKLDEKCENCHHYHSRAVVHMNHQFLEISQACVDCHRVSKLKTESSNMDLDKIYHDENSPVSCIGCHIKMKKGPKDKEQCYECHKGEVDLAKLTDVKGVLPTDIPGDIIIDRLENKYKAVSFEHTLHAKLIGNCGTCHHHQDEYTETADKDQIKGCYVCHPSSFDFEHLNRPRLVGAYHISCLGCHKDRGVGPITCDECHNPPDTNISKNKK